MDGILLADLLESTRVSCLGLDPDVPMETQENCPGCTDLLHVLAVLVAARGRQQMRYGICQRCGYRGYIDRPTPNWIVDFYDGRWDRTFAKTLDQVRTGYALPREGVKASRHKVLSLVVDIDADRDGLICEIGCGYGEIVKNLELAGFKNLIAVEHSRHRAELVRTAFGFTVLHGEFENESVQDELRSRGPLGVVFSHHVLEHTYNPAQVVALASSLQELGGWLVLALPNAVGEHILYGPLFLPHLHAFTKESLEQLLNRHGYQIEVDRSPDDSNTIVGARKLKQPQCRYPRGSDYVGVALDRLRKACCTESVQPGRTARIYWEQRPNHHDISLLLPERRSEAVARLAWLFDSQLAWLKTRLFRSFAAGHTMLVRGLESRYTDPSAAPFEIQFGQEVMLLVK